MFFVFNDSMMAYSRTSQNNAILRFTSAERGSSDRVTIMFGLIPKDMSSL